MSPELIGTSILGLLSAVIATIALRSSTVASRSKDQASTKAIDAQAYDRARKLYESVIDQLEEDAGRLRGQVNSLDQQVSVMREEGEGLRRANQELKSEVFQLRGAVKILQKSNDELHQEIAQLRR